MRDRISKAEELKDSIKKTDEKLKKECEEGVRTVRVEPSESQASISPSDSCLPCQLCDASMMEG